MKKFVKKVLGDPEAKTLRRLRKRVNEINSYEEEYKKLSTKDLRAKTDELKEKILAAGDDPVDVLRFVYIYIAVAAQLAEVLYSNGVLHVAKDMPFPENYIPARRRGPSSLCSV